jgi:hypothetical protein
MNVSADAIGANATAKAIVVESSFFIIVESYSAQFRSRPEDKPQAILAQILSILRRRDKDSITPL